MFRALTCPSLGGKIVFTQHLVSSLSVNVCKVHWLRADCSPLSTSVLLELWAGLVFVRGRTVVTRMANRPYDLGLACRGVWEPIGEGLLCALFYVRSSRLERTLVSSSRYQLRSRCGRKLLQRFASMACRGTPLLLP